MHTLEALYIVKKLEEEKSETTSYHHSLLVHCWYAVVLILGKACCFEFIYHEVRLKFIFSCLGPWLHFYHNAVFVTSIWLNSSFWKLDIETNDVNLDGFRNEY